ncbi:hypothetical protein L596_000380 [Steinernema carpocapsae]|uniref:Uncharacterized protein n=1 Tax=Steinernema carpocapsae TaxID=34508 RepID=A0A4U8UIM0_STECR|nr:hypothetical protein L596_000380 [Steinernema carpocapsae]
MQMNVRGGIALNDIAAPSSGSISVHTLMLLDLKSPRLRPPQNERTGFRATGFRDAAPGTSAAGAVRLGGSGWCSFSLKS